MNKLIATLSACGLCLGVTAPRLANAAPVPDDSADRSLRLDVDITEIIETHGGLDNALLEEFVPVFEAAGFDLVEPGETAATVLRIRLRPLRSDAFDLGVHFEFVDGDAVEPAIEWTECFSCGDSKLNDEIKARQAELFAAINNRFGLEPGSKTSDTSDDPVSEPRPANVAPIGPLGGVGAGFAVIGLGVTIAGAVQWSRGRVIDEDPFSKISEGRDYRPQGQLLVGVGAGALVVGAIMLGVDLGLRAKKRRTPARAQVSPVFGPGQTGLSVSGHF